MKTDDVPRGVRRTDRVVVDQTGRGFQVCWTLGHDQTELGQMTAQGVDQPRTLQDRDRTGLVWRDLLHGGEQ